jgi:hypothetical protein
MPTPLGVLIGNHNRKKVKCRGVPGLEMTLPENEGIEAAQSEEGGDV